MSEKKVVIIAGPNGAGKTTFAREFLPAEAGLPLFVNADLIAAALSPFDPAAAAVRAGRIMLQEIDAHAAAGVRHGGHNVPTEVIRRRFAAGMRNFLEVYRQRVDFWQWFDNSDRPALLIEEGSNH